MSPRHLVRRSGDIALGAPAAGGGAGFRRARVVSEAHGSVHTGFSICELEAGGTVDAHLHSFEESVHVLDGEVVVDVGEGSYMLRPGDYGVLPVGFPHAWRNVAGGPARWVEMTAPQPREAHGGDTFGSDLGPESRPPVPIDVRDPRTRRFGHIDASNMEVDRQTQDMLAVSASMRTALLVYSGITVKMMIDTDLGAQLSTMFMVRYEPRGVAGAHDHPFEETYLILEGEVDAVFDDERHHLGPGDVAWAGVGCVHGFTNPGPGPVRWLETQAPQPPARHSYRFVRDWEHLRVGGS